MKASLLILFVIVFFSCKNEQEENPIQERELVEATTESQTVAKTTWIKSLREFRDALYQDDLEKIKTFIDFPLNEELNFIWFICQDPGEEEYPDLSIPFTEDDFDKSYKNVFSKQFIKSLLKVKTQELYEKGTFETIELQEFPLKYKIYADFYKKTKRLSLALYTEELMYEMQSEVEVPKDQYIESSIIYEFEVNENNEIKFKRIQLAG